MDIIFLALFLGLAAFCLLLGSWKRITLVIIIGVAFLVLSSMIMLGTGVQVINGTETTWVGYNEYANDSVFCHNCTPDYATPTPIACGDSIYPVCDGWCEEGFYCDVFEQSGCECKEFI